MTITATSPRRQRQVSDRGRVTYFLADQPHAVYRIFRADGILLYIGMSSDPEARVQAHRRTQPWRAEIATWTCEWYPTRRDALMAEQPAIDAERPCYGMTTDLYRAVSNLTRTGSSSPTKAADLAALRERYRLDAIATQLARRPIE